MALILLLCVLLFAFSAGCISSSEENTTSNTSNNSASDTQHFDLAAAISNTDKMMMSKFNNYIPHWDTYQIKDDGEIYGIGYGFESKRDPAGDLMKHNGIIFYDINGNIVSATVDGQVLYKDGKDYKYNWNLRFPRPPMPDDT